MKLNMRAFIGNFDSQHIKHFRRYFLLKLLDGSELLVLMGQFKIDYQPYWIWLIDVADIYVVTVTSIIPTTDFIFLDEAAMFVLLRESVYNLLTQRQTVLTNTVNGPCS